MYKTFDDFINEFMFEAEEAVEDVSKVWKAARAYPEDKIKRAINILSGESTLVNRISRAIEVLEEN